MLCKAHAIYVTFLRISVLKENGIIPKPKAFRAFFTLCNGKKALSIRTFNSCNKRILSVKKYCSAAINSVNSKTLHHKRIALRIWIVHPERWNVGFR